MIINSIRGFIMALADSIPGISGGTIAYILGFYDDFLLSLNNILSNDKLKRNTAFIFLIQLLSGWAIGMISSILILSNLFNTKIYFMSSFLIGLTLASLPIIIIEEKKIFTSDFKSIIKYILFFLLGFCIVIFTAIYSKETNQPTISLTNLNFILSIKLIIAGMLAISTMILPGISGSSVLVILKLYIPIINALKQLITFNLNYFFAVLLFGIGILIGIITTVKIVKISLTKHRASTVFFIFGLIIAAIYSIILGPTTLEIPEAPLSFETFNIFAFILGISIILLLQIIKTKKQTKIK